MSLLNSEQKSSLSNLGNNSVGQLSNNLSANISEWAQQGIISPDIHELGITLREFNEKIFSAADSVMIGLMTRQNRSAESRA